jgi:hypothetical protein
MDTETDRERPGPKRHRILDWIPRVEYCPECAKQIVWQERINKRIVVEPIAYHLPSRAGTKLRFRRCCVCAEIEARPWRKRRAAA